MKKWTRRDFLKTSVLAAGTLTASNLLAFDILQPVGDQVGLYPYRGWESFYVNQFAWDSVGRSAHSMNCTGSCTWKAYVKNGILFKEEQFADYPPIETDPSVFKYPSYNPRGCQKGANFKEYTYGPQRLKYPLIRVGARGGGQWRKATWDEALGLVAGKIAYHIQNSGTPGIPNSGADTINFYAAIPAKHHISVAGGFRVANLIGAPVLSFYDWYCDLPPGEPQTWGVQTDACEGADFYNSKLIVLWGANTLETRIPDAHFITEARYNGSKVVGVFPEYNPATTHADLFLPIKPGTDALLALGMAKYIIDNGLFDADYISRFTDMPFLVRTDTNRFLRGTDMTGNAAGGETFYLYDTATGKPAVAPGTGMDPETKVNGALKLGALRPALTGTFTVKDSNGANIVVTTVFQRLKDKLAGATYSLANVSAVTGIDQQVIKTLATDFATIKPARIIEGAGTNHWFHNDLTNRAQILLVALTGNVGVPGGGFDHYVGQEKIWPEKAWFQLAYPLGRPKQRFQNTTLWTYLHAGIDADIDTTLPRPTIDYIKESVANGWMPLWPKGTLQNGRQPKVMIIWGANYINQTKGVDHVFSTLLPKLDLIVDVNFRMDTSAFYADVVLPSAGFYEKWDLNTSDLHTFVIPFSPVIPPQFQSRTDWQIWRGLAQALQNTGLVFDDTVPDGTTVRRDFTKMLADFDTLGTAGTLGPYNLSQDKNAAQFILSNAEETAGMTMDGINQQPKRFVATHEEWTSDLIPGEAYYGFQRLTQHEKPLQTVTGRQQFYIDHDWYLPQTGANPYGLGEELPTWKPPLEVDATRGTYPLRWLTLHGRWSIHSTWRDAKYQLRLQRGRRIVYLNPIDAKARGLVDNDVITVKSPHGPMEANLSISSRIQPGVALMYHGWERYMSNSNWQSVTSIRINPTQLAGGYGQLKFRLNYWGPTGNQKDTRVEVVKKV